MVKLTKRKGFNFFRSYFDVYNELNDSDKLAFIDALLNRQFLGVKPEGLTGMAKFAYISQTNSIDSQVKGYEDKTGVKLGVKNTPTEGGRQGGANTPSQQVEEKGEVKEKGEDEGEGPKININDIEVNGALTLDSYYPLEILKRHYLGSEKVLKAVIDNKENKFKDLDHLKLKLDEFIEHLTGQSEMIKTPKDFASHFRNWNKNLGKIKNHQSKQSPTFSMNR